MKLQRPSTLQQVSCLICYRHSVCATSLKHTRGRKCLPIVASASGEVSRFQRVFLFLSAAQWGRCVLVHKRDRLAAARWPLGKGAATVLGRFDTCYRMPLNHHRIHSCIHITQLTSLYMLPSQYTNTENVWRTTA